MGQRRKTDNRFALACGQRQVLFLSLEVLFAGLPDDI